MEDVRTGWAISTCGNPEYERGGLFRRCVGSTEVFGRFTAGVLVRKDAGPVTDRKDQGGRMLVWGV